MSTYKTNRRHLKEKRGVARYLATLQLGFVVSLTLWSLGCNRASDKKNDARADRTEAELSAGREASLAEQIAEVRAGKNREVRLEQTRISAAELSQLEGLSGLRTLILDAGIVRDEDVDKLATLVGLEHLRLRESPLSDAGLAQLSGYPLDSLVILNLPQATPTAAGLRALQRLPRVRQLRIAGMQIDDAAVEELAKWPELTSIHLIGPALSDRALETIARMPKLSSFYLDDCPLSDAAWEALFRARPTLHVHIDQAHHDRDPSADH